MREAKVGTECWAFSGLNWYPATIVETSDELGFKVSYGPEVTRNWAALGRKTDFDQWVAPYRIHELTPEKPKRLPRLDQSSCRPNDTV